MLGLFDKKRSHRRDRLWLLKNALNLEMLD